MCGDWIRVFLGHTQFEVPVRLLSGYVTWAVMCSGGGIWAGIQLQSLARRWLLMLWAW